MDFPCVISTIISYTTTYEIASLPKKRKRNTYGTNKIFIEYFWFYINNLGEIGIKFNFIHFIHEFYSKLLFQDLGKT